MKMLPIQSLTRHSLRALVAALFTLTAITGYSEQVKLNVAMANPFLQAGTKQTTHLKVGLTGFELQANEDRAPVNVAIVLDKSGSMSGEKIAQAREAAIIAVQKLQAQDIVAIITYDDSVEVLVPATKLTDKETVIAAIRKIKSGGQTALFAGVSKGAAEIRKFIDKEHVNRVILLSDGLANVGPSSPGELGQLGASLAKERISITTIGLGQGYNEDLMAKLAQQSDGNHAYAATADVLPDIFDKEFGDVLSVVAQEVLVRVKCRPGIRPIKVLGREAEISGQVVTVQMNQLLSENEKYVLIEVEVPAGAANTTLPVATVELSYANMSTKTTDQLTSTVAVRFTEDKETVAKAAIKDVQVAVITQTVLDANDVAIALRDQGKIAEAQAVIVANGAMIFSCNATLQSEQLEVLHRYNRADEKYIESDATWNSQRKFMKDTSNNFRMQQSYDGRLMQQ